MYNFPMFDELLSPLYTTEWGRRAGLALMIAMALLVTLLLINSLLSWKDDFALISTPVSHAVSLSTSDEISKMIAKIPERHLFGRADVVNKNVVPVTSLQLRLVGVVKAQPENFSRVIIAEGNKPGKVYQIGDSLPSGVRVYGITEDGVILENGGRLEKLPLQRSQLLFQGMPKPLLNAETPEGE